MEIEAHERLATVETKVTHLEESVLEIKAAIEELKPVVWKAAGGATAAVIIIQMLLKAIH